MNIKPYNDIQKMTYKFRVKISHQPIHNEVEIHNNVEISQNKIQSIINPKYKYYKYVGLELIGLLNLLFPRPPTLSPVHQCL